MQKLFKSSVFSIVMFTNVLPPFFGSWCISETALYLSLKIAFFALKTMVKIACVSVEVCYMYLDGFELRPRFNCNTVLHRRSIVCTILTILQTAKIVKNKTDFNFTLL